jgi:hypothetical protein
VREPRVVESGESGESGERVRMTARSVR